MTISTGMTALCGEARRAFTYPTTQVRRCESANRQNPTFSVRLLAQLRVRTAEVGRRRILADLDNAAADRASAREKLEQRFALAGTDRARQLGQILVEGAEHFQHSVLVGQEDIAPHDRVGGGDAG